MIVYNYCWWDFSFANIPSIFESFWITFSVLNNSQEAIMSNTTQVGAVSKKAKRKNKKLAILKKTIEDYEDRCDFYKG